MSRGDDGPRRADEFSLQNQRLVTFFGAFSQKRNDPIFIALFENVGCGHDTEARAATPLLVDGYAHKSQLSTLNGNCNSLLSPTHLDEIMSGVIVFECLGAARVPLASSRTSDAGLAFTSERSKSALIPL